MSKKTKDKNKYVKVESRNGKIDTKGFDPSSSYVIKPTAERVEPEIVKRSKDIFKDKWGVVTYPFRRKKELEELGLHDDFDPSKSYVFESRKQGIRTWKDFFLVYFVMILAISAFVAILVYHGYLDNPLLKVVKDPTPNPGKIVAVQDAPDDTDPNPLAPRLLEVYGPVSGESVSGRFVADGIATSSFLSVKLEVFDSNDLRLGGSNAGLKGIEPDVRSWTAPIDIEISPSANTGYLLAYPYYEDSKADVALKIPISFQTVGTDLVSLISPLPDQFTNQSSVVFRGNTSLVVDQLQIKLLNEIGEELMNSTLDINDDGNFEKAIVVSKVSGTNSTFGNWKITDGETELLTIPVRFQL